MRPHQAKKKARLKKTFGFSFVGGGERGSWRHFSKVFFPSGMLNPYFMLELGIQNVFTKRGGNRESELYSFSCQKS